MRIQETAKNGVKINIDTTMGSISPNGLITKPKEHIAIYKDSPSDTSKLVDNNFENNYYGTKEELNEIAKDWIDLVLKQLMEKHS